MVQRSTLLLLATALVGLNGHARADDDDHLGEDEWGIELNCTKAESSLRRGEAYGVLRVTGRNADGDFELKGRLEVNIEAGDSGPHPHDLDFQGVLERASSNANARSNDKNSEQIQHIAIDLVDSEDSRLTAIDLLDPTGPGIYPANCGNSYVRRPVIADLAVVQDDQVQARFNRSPRQILVKNVGTVPIDNPSIIVQIGELQQGGNLSAVDPANQTGSLPVDAEGIINLYLAPDSLGRCSDLELVIDSDHSVQSGPSDALSPFENDSTRIATPCITFTTRIDEKALGGPLGNDKLRNVTIQEIVSSKVRVRPDDNEVCTFCHAPGDASPGSSAWVESPTQLVGGRAWGGTGGWAEAFIPLDGTGGKYFKPDSLRNLFDAWRRDGYR